LPINDLTGEHSRRCKGSKCIQKRGPGQNIHQVSSVLEFYSSGFFLVKSETLSHGGHNSFSRGACDLDGRITLREGVVGTGWKWLRIGTGGGRLWVR
jgi:hypothetical protein